MSIVKKIGTGFKVLSKEGICVLNYKFKNKMMYFLSSADPYKVWINNNEADILSTEELKYNPLISVVIPVYNVSEKILSECIDSVLAQTYTNFELCLADDASTMSDVVETLKKYEDNEKIKIVYRKENGHISKATNSAIEMATGEFIAFMDCDDTLAPNALYEVVKMLNANPKLDFIYSDEDKLTADSKSRMNPFFKPDWSPDTFMCTMYTCHLGVYRKVIGDEIGWLNSECDGAQDYDFTMRFTEKTSNIGHISKVLYHWRMIEGSTAANPEAKDYVNKVTVRLKEEALKRRGLEGKIEYVPECYQYRVNYIPTGKPKVSIIIPTKDGFDTYKRCVDSIVNLTDYDNYEIVTVDNGSSEENKSKYENYCKSLKVKDVYLYEKMDFNFSAMCNKGAKNAEGKLLLFLNDDTEVIKGDWLERMAGQAMLKHTGAVGAKLLYPASNLIQHIGVVSMPIGPVHILCKMDDSNVVNFNRNRMDYNYSAVTAACLMVEKSKFEEINGFDESFAVAYNDVKLCFELMSKGYYNICRLDVVLYHYESLTRGNDTNNPEKMKRLLEERKRLYTAFPKMKFADPFYNSNLASDNDDFRFNLKESAKLFKISEYDKDLQPVELTENIRVSIDDISWQFDVEDDTETSQNSCSPHLRISGWFIDENSNTNNLTNAKCIIANDKKKYLINTKKLYQEHMDEIADTRKAYNLSNFYTLLDKRVVDAGRYDIYIGKGNKWYKTGADILIK